MSSAPAQPIPIEGHAHGHHARHRAASDAFSSDSDASSPQTPSAPPLPPPAGPRIASSSPILSYFLSQASSSPTSKSPPGTFPFRRAFGPPVLDDDESPERKPAHARRASSAWAGTERPAPAAPVPAEQHERTAGVLRRLSLGGALGRPQLPATFKVRSDSPPGGAAGDAQARAQAPTLQTPRKARRANTLAPGTARPPRAPSPMGERILKGHFDGFN